jgi:hypothetical protein
LDARGFVAAQVIAVYTGYNGTVTIITAFDCADIGTFARFTVDNRVAGFAIRRGTCCCTVFTTFRNVTGLIKNGMFAGIAFRNHTCAIQTITVGMDIFTRSAAGTALRISIDTNLLSIAVFRCTFIFGTICVQTLTVFTVLAAAASVVAGAAVLNIRCDVYTNRSKRCAAIGLIIAAFKSTGRGFTVIFTSNSLIFVSVKICTFGIAVAAMFHIIFRITNIALKFWTKLLVF